MSQRDSLLLIETGIFIDNALRDGIINAHSADSLRRLSSSEAILVAPSNTDRTAQWTPFPRRSA